ncbi:tyrosine-type recombinase/integrase [Streptomyces sp. TRM43335]|uniref:Tyrosine-type recombinase/integrase n=1 Tax=Streptomyces taklimakanensis TaxID=2569853 RepID=A0A6G2BJ25_9ACTN|nr:tyrosine-type recombinase/integrase [Streptomyces taklimakanensis]MTE22214.1 tyrosine-type recombinase/integrase [Streptomyces taklimakanensis]
MTLTDDRITAERLDELLGDDSVPLAHRALWLLLWECEVKVLDLLSLTRGDIDLAGRRVAGASGRTVAEGEVFLSDRAVELLTELIGDRGAGPLFAVGDRSLGWEEVVRTAEERGHGVHAFRTGGKSHRRGDLPEAGE